MISKRDNELIKKAMEIFLEKINEKFTGDNVSPQFELGIKFFSSGYRDVTISLFQVYDIDMLKMRRDNERDKISSDPQGS